MNEDASKDTGSSVGYGQIRIGWLTTEAAPSPIKHPRMDDFITSSV